MRWPLLWWRPSQLGDNPLAWFIDLDGLCVDARTAPREIQQEAIRLGLIPFLPGQAAPDRVETKAGITASRLEEIAAWCAHSTELASIRRRAKRQFFGTDAVFLTYGPDGHPQNFGQWGRPDAAGRCSSAYPSRTFPAWHSAITDRPMASGGETREPRNAPHQTGLDPERILRRLNRAGVEYVLIGGFAAVIHGYERLTGDLDICYARSRDNVTRLVDVLRSLHAWPREWPEGVPFMLDAQTILNGDSFTFTTEAGDFDLVGTPDGSDGYADLLPGSEMYDLADTLVVNVVGLDDQR
jgi:hypothetical protein